MWINYDSYFNLFSLFLGNFKITQEAEKKFLEAGDATADICDFSSCNGLTLETKEINGKVYTFGECQFPINPEEYVCFVNEDSICPKAPTDFPGIFSSTKPCEDPRSPEPLFFGDFGLLLKLNGY